MFIVFYFLVLSGWVDAGGYTAQQGKALRV